MLAVKKLQKLFVFLILVTFLYLRKIYRVLRGIELGPTGQKAAMLTPQPPKTQGINANFSIL